MSIDVKLFGQLVNAISDIPKEHRATYVKSALTILGEEIYEGGVTRLSPDTRDTNIDFEWRHTRRAEQWMKQNGITNEMLEQVYANNNGSVEIIAGNVPGRSSSARTQHCYLLVGLRSFLETGEAKVNDDEVSSLARQFGCYDKNNNASYRKQLGNSLGGTKQNGFYVTSPGLARAAEMVKEMTSGTSK